MGEYKKAFPYASEKSAGFTTIIKLITFIIIIDSKTYA